MTSRTDQMETESKWLKSTTASQTLTLQPGLYIFYQVFLTERLVRSQEEVSIKMDKEVHCFSFLLSCNKFSCLKQHTFIVSQAWISCVLCSASHKAAVKVLTRCVLTWSLGSPPSLTHVIGRIQIPSILSRLSSYGRRIKANIS